MRPADIQQTGRDGVDQNLIGCQLERQRRVKPQMAARLRAEGFDCFVPHEAFGEGDDDVTVDAVYRVDAGALRAADALVAWLDGPSVDDGTDDDDDLVDPDAPSGPATEANLPNDIPDAQEDDDIVPEAIEELESIPAKIERILQQDAAIKKVGYDIAPERHEFAVEGLRGEAEAGRLKAVLEAVATTIVVKVDAASGKASVETIGGRRERDTLVETAKLAGPLAGAVQLNQTEEPPG